MNAKKYKAVILYLVQKLGGEIRGKKKLAKLLYFADFDYFECQEEFLTGDSYKALPMGPFPEHMPEIIKQLTSSELISVQSVPSRDGYNPTEVYSLIGEEPDFATLSAVERSILDRVATKYGSLSGSQLEVLSHSEAPYSGTKPGEVIPYELSFYRGTDFSDVP